MTELEIEQIRAKFFAWVQLIEFQDWKFKIAKDQSRLFLQVWWADKCTVTGNSTVQSSRKWLLSPHMTKSEFVQTCFKAVLTAMEHEVREQFTYKGEAVYRPHYNVDALYGLCTAKALDCRKEKPHE
jgi:hypothetical protein